MCWPRCSLAADFLRAFDSEGDDLAGAVADLGSRWELIDTGVTVKLYPSCAGTHPTLDAVLDLRARHGFTAADIDRIDVDVDPIVPTILIYDRPATALEAKFSLPFCVAAAVVSGRVGIDTFDDAHLQGKVVLIPICDGETIGAGKPALTEARVHVRLKDGRALVQDAHGARGYPATPASQAELDAKFLACARVALPEPAATDLLQRLGRLGTMESIAGLFE